MKNLDFAPELQLQEIAAKHQLTLDGPIDGTSQTIKATTLQGERVVIKYGKKVNLHEVGLMKTAEGLDVSFRVPELLFANTSNESPYCVRRFIDWPHLNTGSSTVKGNGVMVDVLTKTSRDYQKVLAAYQSTTVSPILAAKGMARFLTAVAWWQAKQSKINPASPRAFWEIERDLVKLYHKYGPGLFGYAHGDIHSEHVLYNGESEKPWLLDLNAQVKPGRGCYDAIRALDACLAHSLDPDSLAMLISAKIKELENQFDPLLVRTLTRARMLAIGTDIERDQKQGKNMPHIEARRRLSKLFVEMS